MIISMPRVRLAPGVWSMSARVMSVVGVTESGGERSCPCTLTVSVVAAMESITWTTGIGAGGDGDGSWSVAKPEAETVRLVDADGDLGEGEFALCVGGGLEREGGVAGMEGYGRAGDGAMLGIVDDAVDGGKDRGVRGN